MRRFEFTFDVYNKEQTIFVEARTKFDAQIMFRDMLLQSARYAECKELAAIYEEGCYVTTR